MKSSYADDLVKAEWSLDHYEAVDIDGRILEDAVGAEGEMVQATAALSCGDYKEEYVFSFMVYPPDLSEEEQLLKHVQSAIDKESAREGSEFLTLPEEVDGISLKWSEKKQHLVWKVLLFEIVILILLRFSDARTQTDS